MLTYTRGSFWYKEILILITIILIWPVCAGAAAFHAIIAGDTADQNVGEGVTADVRHMWEFVNNVRQNTPWDNRGTLKMLVTRLVLEGQALEETLSHSNLLRVLQEIPAGPDDVIFFYYSGHGAGDDSGRVIWPSLFFENRYFPYEKLLEILNAKKPRLLIVITDACNNFSDWTPDLQFRWNSRMKRTLPDQDNYKALFLDQQGYILATSSIPGEISSALSSRPGSLFTNDLLSRLNQELQTSGVPKWEHIITTELRVDDQYEVYTQHPQYKIQTKAFSRQSQTATPTPTPLPVRPTPTPTAIQPTRPIPTPTPSAVLTPEPLGSGQVSLGLSKPCGSLYSRREPVQVQFRTNQDGYAMLYTIDAYNNVSLLFPNRHTPDNVVRASTQYTIPDSSSAYRQGVPGSPGFNEVRLLFSSNDFYHQSYPELQQELVLFLDDLASGRYRNYVEESCTFYLRQRYQE